MAGVGVGGALLPGQPQLGLAALVAGLGCLALGFVLRPVLVALAVAAALLGVARAELGAGDPSLPGRAAALAGRLLAIEALVAEDPRATGQGLEVLVTPLHMSDASGSIAPAGKLLVRTRTLAELTVGDTVSLVGRPHPPQDRPGFNRRAYLAQRQAYLEVQVPRLEVVASPAGLDSAPGVPGRIRALYVSASERLLPAPYSALLVGVVLGVRNRIPAQIQRDLVTTGLVHLLVLSGLKVAVFTRLAAGLLRPLLGRASLIPVLALVGLYALVGGGTPAAIRAAAMGGLVAVGLFLGRPTHVWTSLAAAAAAMVAWSPELVSDVGYQLSFIGTAAIILLTPPIEDRLGWLPGFFREPFAVTAAAQLGTLPLMATDFHLFSPSAPLANALVLPLLPALILGGLLLPPLVSTPVLIELARLLAHPLAALLGFLVQVAACLARMPVASFPAPDFSGPPGFAYYGAVGAILGASRSEGGRRRTLLAAGILLPILVGAGELALWGRGPAAVAVLAVGEGQALLVTGPAGHVLIDAGPDPTRLGAELGSRLPPWERRLQGLVLTGTGAAQTAGLAGLDRSTEVVALPAGPLQGSAWRQSLLPSIAGGASVLQLRAGQAFELAGLRFQVLAPEAGGDQLGIRISRGAGPSFCALGGLDGEAQAQVAARLLALGGGCTTLLLPGGGHAAPDPGLLGAAHPQRLIAALGGGRIDRSLPAARVERTDQEGTIVVPL